MGLINSIKTGSTVHNLGLPYGVCETAAATAAKTVTVNGFSLETGAMVVVTFTQTNSATSPTLNVNSTGAKAISRGDIFSLQLQANKTYIFVYDGTKYQQFGAVNQNAFSAIHADDINITAQNPTDYFYMLSGNNITLEEATGGYGIVISAKDTTYSAATTSAAGLMSAADKTKLNGIATGANAYSLPTASSSTLGGIKVGSNLSISSGTLSVPAATDSTAGVTVVYPAAKCTTYTSDSGTCTPLAVQNAAKKFAITRPSSATENAVVRFSNTTGDIKDSPKVRIEDVTNTKDTSKKASVLVIDAEGGKKMVYGYCTDQVDGTSFIGGVFDASATSYPYASGLAIGGTSGNLLWKGKQVATTDMIPTNTDQKTSSGNTSSKIYLVGATSQTTSGVTTYSHDTAYVGTDGYLYSNSEKVWPRIYSTLVPYGTEIPANADLNTVNYLKVGNYYCGSNATVKTLKNCPLTTYGSDGAGTAGAAFMMTVYSPLLATFDDETTGTWRYRIRKITHYNTGVEYIQYCYVGGTAGAANWTYGDWYVTPLSKFTFNKTSSSTAAIGSSSRPVYVDSRARIQPCDENPKLTVAYGTDYTTFRARNTALYSSTATLPTASTSKNGSVVLIYE